MPYFLQFILIISLFSQQIYAATNSIGAIGINGQFTTTGSYTADTSSTYNNSTAPDLLYFNVTLPISQPNNLYILGVTLNRLEYNYINNLAYLYVKLDIKTTTYFKVKLFSPYSQYMSSIGFRYLMITSSWTIFKAQYTSWWPIVRSVTTNVQINTTITTGVSVVNMTGGVGFYYCLTGFYYTFLSFLNQDIGNYLIVSRQNATSLFMKLQRPYGYNYYCGAVFIFSISFNLGELSSVGVLRGTQFVGFYDKQSNIALSSVNYNSLFYGLIALHAPRGVPLSIILTHTTSTVTIASGLASNLFKVNYFLLSVATADGCCQATPYFHSANNLCYDQCPDEFYQNSTNFECLPCGYQCLICSNITSCTTCKLGYYYIVTHCISQQCGNGNISIYEDCDDGNFLNNDGCSMNCTVEPRFYCSVVSLISICLPCSKNCLQCDNGSYCTQCQHHMTLWNQTCICSVGQWLVTRLCTSVVGCIATAQQNNIVVCKACNIYKKLSLINGKCQCPNGFRLNYGLSCQEICGDGKLFLQECDDGNVMNGDGCSSTCLIEKNYICLNGSNSLTSNCAYSGRNFHIFLVSADKIDYVNKGIFIFKVFPALFNFQKNNFINSLVFQSSRTTSIVGWSYDRGEIQLEIEYSESLQEFEANLTLVFNQSIIIQQPVSINFIMVSKGAKLIIVQNYQTIKVMEYILFGFSSFILLLFVFGSLFHKMIGVETLHAFQLLYFIHSLDKSYTSLYSTFRFLTYLNCNFLYFFNKELSIPHPNNSFTYNKNNQQFSNLIIVGLSFMALALSIIFKIKSIKNQKDHQNKRTSQKPSAYIYNHFAFPLFIGFYWAITLNYFNVRDNQKISLFESIPIMFSALISLIFLIVLGYIFWFQWKGILTNQRNKQSYFGLTKCNPNHIPIYLSYVFLINLCLVVQYLGLLTFSKEIIMVLTLLLLIKYCYNKPYKNGIHNAGIIFNLLMVQIFIIWTLVRNISQSVIEEDKQLLIIGVFFILMITSIVIWAVRIIYEVRSCCSTEFKQKKNKKNHKNFIQKDINIIKQKLNEERVKQQLSKLNKYCLKVMKQKDDFDDWNQQNKQMLLSNMMGVSSIDVDKKMQGMQKLYKKRMQKQVNAQKQIKQIKQRLKKSFKQKQVSINRKLNNNDNEH